MLLPTVPLRSRATAAHGSARLPTARRLPTACCCAAWAGAGRRWEFILVWGPSPEPLCACTRSGATSEAAAACGGPPWQAGRPGPMWRRVCAGQSAAALSFLASLCSNNCVRLLSYALVSYDNCKSACNGQELNFAQAKLGERRGLTSAAASSCAAPPPPPLPPPCLPPPPAPPLRGTLRLRQAQQQAGAKLALASHSCSCRQLPAGGRQS